ncbi:MAG: molybdopterin-dependent oxidoreductase, partial [Thermoanaerobaculia bacterium]|nr:molybdopterin-dependent oxidoreductase [Thermoanaerobaculia bacterium]
EAPPAGDLRLPGGRSVAHDALRRAASDRGPVTLECAGNFRQAGFGMLSRARFAGVPLADLLGAIAATALVEVAGVGRFPADGPGSTSWIFRASDLLGAGAFLATSLGGAPLSRAHGAPVRLVVPGWYGCCAIKWVRSIVLVPPDAPATPQMAEYASRTHQDGVPEQARDFRPATVACAAVITRMTRAGRAFTAEGLVWGGTQPVGRVVVRVNGEDSAGADVMQAGGSRENWGFFRARFEPGRAAEALLDARADAPVPQPRVDAGWYARRVALDGV